MHKITFITSSKGLLATSCLYTLSALSKRVLIVATIFFRSSSFSIVSTAQHDRAVKE